MEIYWPMGLGVEFTSIDRRYTMPCNKKLLETLK